MTVHLVTGHAGEVHVTAAEQGALNAKLWGSGSYVLEGCDVSIAGNNTVHVGEGIMLLQGRHVTVKNGGEDVAIENGTVDKKRRDLVCVKYEMDALSGVEKCSLEVVRGEEGSSYTTPELAKQSILDGDNPCLIALATADVNEKLKLEAVKPLLSAFPTYEEMMAELDRKIEGVQGGFYVGDTAPANTALLWVDTGNASCIKYYDGKESAWKTTGSTWG